VVLVGLTLGASIVVPWGARYQFAAVIAVTAVTIWALATIRPGSRDFWLPPTGSVLPTYAASILVSYLFRRERRAIFTAQHHRRVREAELQAANRELEEEVRRHEKTEERLRFAMLELDHRVKNTLATLESIAQQTLDTSPTPADFVVAFRGRLRAVASIHDALAQRRGNDLGVRELLELVVGPYRVADDSISLACDDALLSPAKRAPWAPLCTSLRPTHPSTAPCRRRRARSRSKLASPAAKTSESTSTGVRSAVRRSASPTAAAWAPS